MLDDTNLHVCLACFYIIIALLLLCGISYLFYSSILEVDFVNAQLMNLNANILHQKVIFTYKFVESFGYYLLY